MKCVRYSKMLLNDSVEFEEHIYTCRHGMSKSSGITVSSIFTQKHTKLALNDFLSIKNIVVVKKVIISHVSVFIFFLLFIVKNNRIIDNKHTFIRNTQQVRL